MRPSYIEACKSAGRLLDEQPFEWFTDLNDRSIDDSMGYAPKYWREKFRITGNKAFYNWNVILVADQKRLALLKNILWAGGAQVHSLPTDLNNNISISKITHVLFTSPQMRAKIPAELSALLTGKFHNIEIIANHLLEIKK